MEFAHVDLQSDKEVVLAAVKRAGGSLQYASDDLRADSKIVHAACDESPFASEYSLLHEVVLAQYTARLAMEEEEDIDG